ncbi:WhiB family transcriptional regulator [Streptomyces olivochromogenes]|uniref:Transcriptional regulator WhiB n=1 Tax=Streptomyces olivochromogenes TaxID=1963 RepID=A0A250VSZ5_STROL|nr:WhiB family transcriptional regulator [Streptomyces olivochromogenes]KUN38198.1 hypothetical protein AQJ27_44655 [Streptomyces olivochromogenes]GAX57368.1 transcriptional regulator WhiB [Streptomyces olivochromogenes]
MSTLDPIEAAAAFYEHRFAKYKGCAPHWDPALPGRALGDASLSLDAWSSSSEDGGEAQKDRLAREKRALAVCRACPVLEACRAYANSETADGKLVQPDGIWGGELALDRHRALIARRANAPLPARQDLAEARTVQKRAVLAALARETDEELVAYRAGMDVRTANWNRSVLCTLLGLNKETATREQLLRLAAAHDLLPRRCRIVPDGQWPIAAAPTTDGARQRRIAAGAPQQLVLNLWPGQPAPRRGPRPRQTPSAAASARRSLRPRLRLVAPYVAEPLPFPTTIRTARLEAAA